MAELHFVVSLYANTDMYEEYKVEPMKVFSNQHWLIYYGILSAMIEKKKVSEIDQINIEMYISEQGEKLRAMYEKAGGWHTIEEAKQIIETENIDAYYREVLRYSAILKLHDSGFNIEKNWDKYSKLTYEELADAVTGSVDSIFAGIDMGEDKVEDMVDGMWEMLEEADKGSMRGLPVSSKLLNSVVNGQVAGNITMVAGASGAGKAQPISTIIPTPKGDRMMGDLKVGDYVFDRQGNPTKILGVFPQGELDAYEVTLGDGRKTICNDEHLWSYYTSKGNLNTKTLREMMDIGINKGVGKRWRIPTNEAVQYKEKELPLSPYALGAFIGDGSLSLPLKPIVLSSVDEFVVSKVATEIGAVGYKKVPSENHSWVFHHEPREYSYSGGMYGQTINKTRFQITTKELFEKIPDLMTTSHHKFIPKEYLNGSIKQRTDLLQGLMDTDGYIQNGDRYQVRYSTMSEQLGKDVVSLCLSLGYLATLIVSDRKEKGIEYSVNINIPNEKKCEIFTLPRRLNVAKEASIFKKKRNYWRIAISNVEKLEDKQEMVCIMVDNDEHLYLTNDFIVTHNTFITLAQTLPTALKMKEPLFIMCNEEDKKKWQREIIAWQINNIQKKDLVKSRFYQGEFTADEWEMFRIARDWLNEMLANGLIQFVNFSTFSMNKSIKLIRKYATQKSIKYFIIDTLKLDNDVGSNVTELAWLQLQQNMVKLYNVIKPTAKNVHVWVTYQLNKSVRARFLDQSALGMSKNVADVVSTLILVRNVLESEKGANGLKVKRADGQSVELSEEKEYMIAFIDKNRQGSTSSQIVWRVDKGRNIMKDVGFTKVSQDY